MRRMQKSPLFILITLLVCAISIGWFGHSSANAEGVAFSDPVFEQSLRIAIKRPEGPIFPEELARYTTLIIDAKSRLFFSEDDQTRYHENTYEGAADAYADVKDTLSTAQDLHHFTGLESLVLERHPVRDISPSSATFPSDFIREEDSVTRVQAALDIEVFIKIADHLNISVRYVGEEPKSVITGMYNEVMKELLPIHGIKCVEIPRVLSGSEVISASTVRTLIHDGKTKEIRPFVPPATFAYFMSDVAKPVIDAITSVNDVVHE